MTRIPLPGNMIDTLMKGVDTGGAMYTRAMQPILDREHQKQLDEHFKQEMALKLKQFARSGANADIQRKILEQQLLGLTHKNDPMYEINQFAALQNMLTGGGGGQGQAPAVPTQEMGEGMGMFTPEGMQEAQAAPVAPPTGGGQGGAINLDALRQNPLLRGFFKHKFGIDPLAPAALTQDEKDKHALDLFQQKENIKKQNKGGDVPTNAVLTQNQQAIQGIDTVLPMLDELISSKNIPGIMNLSPGAKAAYNAKTSSMIDTLVAAQSLPKVQASIDLVEEQIRRKTGETVHDYKERLKDLKKDLMKRRVRSKDVLSNRKVNTAESDDFAGMSDEELQRIAGGG